MNNSRRKALKQIICYLENVYNSLQIVIDDEEMAFDNMPENLQYSMRGEESQEAIDNLNEEQQKLDEIIDRLKEIVL